MSNRHLVYPKPNRRVRRRLEEALTRYRTAEFADGAPSRQNAQDVADAADVLLLESRSYRFGRATPVDEP